MQQEYELSVDVMYKALAGISDLQLRQYLTEAVDKAAAGDMKPLLYASNLKRVPVPPEEFFLAKEYMAAKQFLSPAVVDELIKINQSGIVEALFVGGIGSAKTTAALYTNAYQLYLLSCLKSPHRMYQLDPSSEILFVFQNKTETLAKEVSYNRFKSMIAQSEYFHTYYPFNTNIESKLVFPDRIEVHPVGGGQFAAIGQNVMGGIIDELNYMERVESSKKSIDGGQYDQAVSVYSAISRRRKSRFAKQGSQPGILCLVSSRRYPGQFTDTKELEARTDPTIYVYDKCTWDIKPEGTFTSGYFKVFVGDGASRPQILTEADYEALPQDKKALVKEIPEDYRSDFERDIYDSLREIAGVSTLAATPFMPNISLIAKSFGRVKSILSGVTTDFTEETLLSAFPDNVRDKDKPRFVHMDLSLTGDRTGIAMGFLNKFVAIDRGDNLVEILPEIIIDFTLEVVPPIGGEVEYHRIRSLIQNLKAKLGINIKWVTCDQFQSADNLQLLRQAGYTTGRQSVDITTTPYELVKSAIYDGRLLQPENDKLKRELSTLERDMHKNKIDHPAYSSKDISDALAGVVYGLTMRRELWVSAGVTLGKVPDSIRDMLKAKDNLKKAG